MCKCLIFKYNGAQSSPDMKLYGFSVVVVENIFPCSIVTCVQFVLNNEDK